MTLTELLNAIAGVPWFSHLGETINKPGLVQIRNLEAWRSDDPVTDAATERIAEAMVWLPSTADQADPFDNEAMDALKRTGREEEARAATILAHKAALVSLRTMAPSVSLQVGPHDFSQVAKGAATYAVRRTALEILAGHSGKWTELFRLYELGHWPLGYLPTGEIVVL